jgi:hypothetical protein
MRQIFSLFLTVVSSVSLSAQVRTSDSAYVDGSVLVKIESDELAAQARSFENEARFSAFFRLNNTDFNIKDHEWPFHKELGSLGNVVRLQITGDERAFCEFVSILPFIEYAEREPVYSFHHTPKDLVP